MNSRMGRILVENMIIHFNPIKLCLKMINYDKFINHSIKINKLNFCTLIIYLHYCLLSFNIVLPFNHTS